MLDRFALKLLHPPLNGCAAFLHARGVKPDLVTVAGFIIGMAGAVSVVFHYYSTALVLVLLNRFFDGLDGALARKGASTDAGGFLDIVLDFIFYSAVVFGFSLADPFANSFAASLLVFSFIGTGCSFLAFAIIAERRKLPSRAYPTKGFYYLGGLTEGTETIIFLCLCCLVPQFFPVLAYIFAGLCWITTFTRVVGGYNIIKRDESG